MKFKFASILALAIIFMVSCGDDKAKKETSNASAETKKPEVIDPMKDKGVGPVKSITLTDIDEAVAIEGKAIFKAKCKACHRVGKRFIGPDVTGVTTRRTPEWIMNMILNPDQMVKENAQARQLLMEYSAPMANQSLTEDEARKILEYFRTLETKK